MFEAHDHNVPGQEPEAGHRAGRDVLTLGIAVAAVMLFVATGGIVLPGIIRSWLYDTAGPDSLLVNALLLNIALVIFGWRRYSELNREVSERRRAEEQARILAETDPLTGSLNRRSLGKAGAGLIASSIGDRRSAVALMLDLDNFKQINDLNGHKTGDHVLVEVTRRIRGVIPKEALLARIGGDEFAVYTDFDPRLPDRIEALASRIIRKVAEPVIFDGLTLDVTVSIGIAALDKEAADSDFEEQAGSLLHRADIAMYHAKKRGKNGHFWFETTMENELRFRNELESGIRNGLTKGEFVPYYEQQIDLATGQLVGFEMLARWHSPQLGLVSPEIFIPIAEDIGLIGEMSESLIKQALDDAQYWDPKLTLSVNISPLQLRDPWFSQKLLRLLVEARFPPERLDIEITESCLHENIGVVRSVVTSLKNQGIRISLDDFGTGYSSLAQLRSLPFDRIKIDRSFVSELAAAEGGSKIVEAIVSLGRGLDLPITAEGIESDDILQLLKQMGELKGQGYLYGRPEDAKATRERLAKQQLLAKKEGSKKADQAAEEAAIEDRKAAG